MLQGDSVALREWSEGDLSLLQCLLGDPDMMKHLGGPESAETIRNRHQRYLAMNSADKGRMFVITAGAAAEPVGSVGYWEREWQGQTVWETGWFVLPRYQGRGLATKGVAAVLGRARDAGKHRFIHAFPSVENPPSNAICRKAGFTLAGEVDFEYPVGDLMRCNDWCFDLTASTL